MAAADVVVRRHLPDIVPPQDQALIGTQLKVHSVSTDMCGTADIVAAKEGNSWLGATESVGVRAIGLGRTLPRTLSLAEIVVERYIIAAGDVRIVMREVKHVLIDIHEVVRAVEEQLALYVSVEGAELRVLPVVRGSEVGVPVEAAIIMALQQQQQKQSLQSGGCNNTTLQHDALHRHRTPSHKC